VPEDPHRAEHPSDAPVTAFDAAAADARTSLLGRLLRRGQPRKLTVEELGGPEPLPLVAGRFAAPPELSLEGWLAKYGDQDEMFPGHDPGAVEEWRRRHQPRPFPGVVNPTPRAK